MPLTFGAATSDRVSWTTNLQGVTGTNNFVACWFNASTLTAGRYILAWCSASATTLHGIRIGTTTSTLQLVAAATTTLGIWTATPDTTSFPSGIVTGQWYFVAVAQTIVTGPTVGFAAWLGTESVPPTPMTIATSTAPAGTPTGGANIVVGNNIITSPTAAFQGDIGQVIAISNPSGINWQIGSATAGTFSTDEQLLIAQTLTYPLWLGRPPVQSGRDSSSTLTSFETFDGKFVAAKQTTASNAYTTTTITGATYSQSEQPRVWDAGMFGRPLTLVRR